MQARALRSVASLLRQSASATADSTGFPLAAPLRPSPARAAGFASAGWRASGASATWSPPTQDREIAHILPEGPQACPSRPGNPMILKLGANCSFVLLLGALMAPMASGAPARPVQ